MKQISLFDFDEKAAEEIPPKKAVAQTFPDESTRLPENSIVSESVEVVEGIEEFKAEESIIDIPGLREEKPDPLVAPRKNKRGRKSASEMAASVHFVQVPADDVLFQKRYYSIGEVATMFGENISLIRFWENEFTILKPRKNGKGDRFFRPEDVKNLKIIHHLLREQKYTVEGAKDYMKRNKKKEQTFEVIHQLQELQGFLREIQASL